MVHHRWAGWPGNFCLDCGIDDPVEIAIADNLYDPETQTWKDTPEAHRLRELSHKDCPEPGSHRHDPYFNHRKMHGVYPVIVKPTAWHSRPWLWMKNAWEKIKILWQKQQ
jgi:hypothetical protein